MANKPRKGPHCWQGYHETKNSCSLFYKMDEINKRAIQPIRSRRIFPRSEHNSHTNSLRAKQKTFLTLTATSVTLISARPQPCFTTMLYALLSGISHRDSSMDREPTKPNGGKDSLVMGEDELDGRSNLKHWLLSFVHRPQSH